MYCKHTYEWLIAFFSNYKKKFMHTDHKVIGCNFFVVCNCSNKFLVVFPAPYLIERFFWWHQITTTTQVQYGSNQNLSKTEGTNYQWPPSHGEIFPVLWCGLKNSHSSSVYYIYTCIYNNTCLYILPAVPFCLYTFWEYVYSIVLYLSVLVNIVSHIHHCTGSLLL